MSPRRFSASQLRALRKSVKPEQLRQAAAMVGPEQRRLFLRLADALEADDPGALEALAAELSSGQAEALQGSLREALLGAAAMMASLQEQLGGLTQQLAPLAEAQAEIRDAIPSLGEAGLDAELAERLQAAMAELGEQTLGPVGALLRDSHGVSIMLRSVAQDLADGGEPRPELLRALEAAVGGLRGRLDAASGLSPAAALLPATRVLREAAEELGRDAEALQLGLLQTALEQLDRGDPTPLEGWSEALDRAEALGDPRLARHAAKVLQAHALQQGELAAVARLSERLAKLAARSADRDVQVLSLCESGLAWVRAGKGKLGARQLDAALRLAEGDRSLSRRARLTRAQAHEMLSEYEAAGELYVALVEESARHELVDAVFGFCLLGAGRCWPGELLDPGRLQALDRALDVARDLGDANLFLQVVQARVATLDAAGERARVVDELVPARAEGHRRFGAPVAGAIDKVAAALREAWGASDFDGELLAFRGRQGERR